MSGWSFSGGTYTLSTGGPTYVYIPTDSTGAAITTPGSTSIRLTVRQPEDNVALRLFASGDLNSGWEVRTDATNVVIRKVTFGVPAAASDTTAHGLTAATPFTIEVRPVGTDIQVFINGSATQLSHFDIAADSAPKYDGLDNFGLAGDTDTAMVTKIELLTLAIVYTTRADVLYAVCGGELWASTDGQSIALVGRGLFNTLGPVDADDQDQKVALVDGTHAVLFDPITMTAEKYTATDGALPGHTTDGTTTATLTRSYLGRRAFNEDQNLWFTAVNSEKDLNTGKDIPGSAFALAAAFASKIGQPIRALFVAAKTRLIIGCSRSIWEMRGDPAIGSVEINRIIDGVGISGKDAMVMAAEGYIVAHSTQGLLLIPDGGLPQFLSRGVLTTYLSIDAPLTDYIVQLRRDIKRNVLMIFMTTASGPSVHICYDERIGKFQVPETGTMMPAGIGAAYFPETYPDRVGPCASCYYNGELLLLGRDGYIYTYDDAAKTDDGDLIDSFAAANLNASPDLDNDTRVHSMDIALASGSDPLQIEVYTGQTPEEAYEGANRQLRRRLTVSSPRNSPTINVRAPAVVVELSTAGIGTAWKLEGAQFDYEELPLTYGTRLPADAPSAPCGPYIAPVTPGTNTGPGSGTGGDGTGPGDHGDSCVMCATWMAAHTDSTVGGQAAVRLAGPDTLANVQAATKAALAAILGANICGLKNPIVYTVFKSGGSHTTDSPSSVLVASVGEQEDYAPANPMTDVPTDPYWYVYFRCGDQE